VDRLEAVKTAKQYISDLYSSEGTTKTRLQELNFDRANASWLITIGFAYLIGDSGASTGLGSSLTKAVYGDRLYKLVRVDDQTGEVIGMTDRLLDPSPPQ
jgi:hypothetical protein